MPFDLIQPSIRLKLGKVSTVHIRRRQIYFNRKATRDIFGDQAGYVQFFLKCENKQLRVKPTNSPESAFSVRVYRKEKSPIGVVFATGVAAKILDLLEKGQRTFALSKEPDSFGSYIVNLE